MKVLMISEYWHPKIRGGGEISPFLLAKHLIQQNVEVHVLTSHFKNLKKEENLEGMMVHRNLKTGEDPSAFISNIKRNLFFKQSLKREFLALYNKEKFDIVHCFNLTSTPIIKLKDKINAKFVAHVNNNLPFCPKGDLMFNGITSCDKYNTGIKCIPCIMKSKEVGKMRNNFYLKYNPYFWYLIYRRCSNIINNLKMFDFLTAISEFTQEELVRRGFDRDKIAVIPNIVEIDKFLKIEKANNKVPRLLYLGSYIRSKGPQVFLNSLNGLNLDYEASFYGNGTLKERMQDFVRRNKIPATINDAVSYEKITELYQEHDIIIFPSLWPEPFGRIIIESMAAGRPIVASNVGSVKYLIKGGETGLLFSPGDADDLKATLKRLMTNSHLQNEIVLKAREESKKYSGDVIAVKLKKLYGVLLYAGE